MPGSQSRPTASSFGPRKGGRGEEGFGPRHSESICEGRVDLLRRLSSHLASLSRSNKAPRTSSIAGSPDLQNILYSALASVLMVGLARATVFHSTPQQLIKVCQVQLCCTLVFVFRAALAVNALRSARARQHVNQVRVEI